MRHACEKKHEQYLKEQKASLEQEVKAAENEGYKVNYLENPEWFVPPVIVPACSKNTTEQKI